MKPLNSVFFFMNSLFSDMASPSLKQKGRVSSRTPGPRCVRRRRSARLAAQQTLGSLVIGTTEGFGKTVTSDPRTGQGGQSSATDRHDTSHQLRQCYRHKSLFVALSDGDVSKGREKKARRAKFPIGAWTQIDVRVLKLLRRDDSQMFHYFARTRRLKTRGPESFRSP